MTKEQYFIFHREATRKMYSITQEKNADYTGDSDNPFSNFMDTALIAGVPADRARPVTPWPRCR